MSTQTGTSPQQEVKDAFGRGLGLAHQLGIALGKEGVTPAMLQQVRANPLVTKRVAAAIKGVSLGSAIALDDLVERELEMTARFVERAKIGFAGDPPMLKEAITSQLRHAQEIWEGLTEHDRFSLGGLQLQNIFGFFYGFNNQQESEGGQQIKLCHGAEQEWWRTDKSVEHMPTQAGVIRCNFAEIMKATDFAGRPFNRNSADQEIWIKEQGGPGHPSAEQVMYLFARSVLEYNRPLWGAGSIRCKNRFGSDGSLIVDFDADDGLFVGRCGLDYCDWFIAALPWKFVAIGD